MWQVTVNVLACIGGACVLCSIAFAVMIANAPRIEHDSPVGWDYDGPVTRAEKHQRAELAKAKS